MITVRDRRLSRLDVPVRVQATQKQDGCAGRCPGGWPCSLNPSTKHHLHICQDVKCKCHSRERYARERKNTQNP